MSAKLTTDQADVAIHGDLTRYRALLKISGTVGAQPKVDAVFHSLAALLSNVVSFENIALLLFDSSGQRLALRAFERSHDDANSNAAGRFGFARSGAKLGRRRETITGAYGKSCIPRREGCRNRGGARRHGRL